MHTVIKNGIFPDVVFNPNCLPDKNTQDLIQFFVNENKSLIPNDFKISLLGFATMVLGQNKNKKSQFIAKEIINELLKEKNEN